jgi:hypothetical protein
MILPELSNPLSVLSAMITPAVLISACGTLIVSTSMRLARIVDRVRALTQSIEQLSTDEAVDFPEERLHEYERQLTTHTQRGVLIQRSLTNLYISLGLFVTTTVCIALVALVQYLGWLPMVLGILGTLFLFYSSMLLIAETRLALRSVNFEMEFTMQLRQRYQDRRREAAGLPATANEETEATSTKSLRKITQKLGIG